MYCDRDLRRKGFPGEGVKGSIVLVVKSHSHEFLYHSVVFLVRNPFNALVSEWQRQLGKSHTGVIEPSHFGKKKACLN